MSRLESVLAIWGVIGPLITGAISALWVRRNTIKDREHELRQRAADHALQAHERTETRRVEVLEAQYNEIKNAILAFYAAADMYVAAVDAGGTQPKENEFALTAQHADALTRAEALIELVTDDEVTRAAREWRNACLEIAAATEATSSADLQKLELQVGTAQDAFIRAARTYLASMPRA